MGLIISGIEQNVSAIGEYATALQEKLTEEISAAVNTAYDSMVGDSPVDTGFLQSSWNLEESDTNWTITNDCEYVGFVEFGHSTRSGSFVPGQNWIEPAYETLRSDLESIIRDFST